MKGSLKLLSLLKFTLFGHKWVGMAMISCFIYCILLLRFRRPSMAFVKSSPDTSLNVSKTWTAHALTPVNFSDLNFAKFYSWLSLHQNTCSFPILFASPMKHGIGSAINEYARVFAWALMMGRVFVPSGKWIFASGVCPEENWACYFEISPCFTEERLQKAIKMNSSNEIVNCGHNDVFLDLSTDLQRRTIRPLFLKIAMQQYSLSPEKVWGGLLTYLLQPKPSFKDAIEAASLKFSNSDDVVGLHIRSSDLMVFVSDGRCSIPDGVYLEELDAFHNLKAFSYVFVATDDANRTSEAMQVKYKKPYQFVGAKRDLVDRGVVVAAHVMMSNQKNFEIVTEAFADIFHLATARSFVGSGSNWAAIVLGLRAAGNLNGSTILVLDGAVNGSCNNLRKFVDKDAVASMLEAFYFP